MKLIENIIIFALAIIFFIPYQIFRYFKPKQTESTINKPTEQSNAAFSILGISPTSNRETIKSAYRKLVKQHHPDHNGNPQMFIKIQKAYEELTQ